MKVRNHALIGFFVENDKGEIQKGLFPTHALATAHANTLKKSVNKPITAVKKSKKVKK